MKEIKAVRIHNYEGPQGLRVENVSLPQPQSGEVLIRVHAAGVNPIDWKIRAGHMRSRMASHLPFTLGVDLSGVIEAIGPDVADLKIGDEVYGQAAVFNGGSGSFAEAAVTPASGVAAKPQKLDYPEAGALPLAGVSALQALTEHLRISPGQKVLIHGGAGGIGSIAIQIAKHLGAYVATTVSPRNIDFSKRLGADEVIDYNKENFADVLNGFDAVLDTVGGDTYVRSFKVLKKGGRIVSLLESPREDLMKEFGVEASSIFTQATTERLMKLAELVDQGAVRVEIEKTFPLDLAAAALDYVEKQSPRGKVALIVS